MMLTTLLAPVLAFAPSNDETVTVDWTHLRGPHLDGRADGGGVFEEAFGLELDWKAPLGSAYSGVAVAEGRVVTTLSDGETDWLVALSDTDGSVMWKHPFGPVYHGHDGSEDGPVGSPVIGGDRVFVVGPRGTLVAVSAADGEELWSRQLVSDMDATQPDYGFGTTPLVVDDLLIVQAGGSEGRAICGFDAATGELRWSLGASPAGYQSPTLMELAGRVQVVVLNGRELLGLVPETGEILWKHEMGERDSARSGIATPIGPNRFCAYVSGSIAAFEVEAAEDGSLAARELFRSRELGNSYAAPVYHDGHLYGFRSDFLTCIDATTGKRVWKSRPPGGRGLILVDDRLVVFGAEGVVAVARATPEDYVEEARVAALAHSSYSWPSFASGRIFVRNSEEVACISIGEPEPAEPVASRAAPGDHAFGRFVQEVDAAENKQELIDAFLASQEQFPVVEGNFVHFTFQGEAEDVAITGNMVAGQPETMQRIEDTNFWFASYEIEPGARWEYRFQVDYDQGRPDPLNERTVPAPWGTPFSEVLTPDYEAPTHILEPTGERGRVESFEFESEKLDNKREIQVYLPPGYDESDESYPLLIVHRGPDWLQNGLMANSLDNLIGASVRPLVVAFVAPIGQWWLEAGGTGTKEYLEALSTEFIATLEERYRLSSRPEDRALMGTAHFSMTVVYGVLLHPDVFGKAAIQSATTRDVTQHAIFELLEEGPRRNVAFYLDWNRYEERNADHDVDYGEDSQGLAAALEAAGYDYTGGEALDGHGWGSWRARTDDLLEALFPLE